MANDERLFKFLLKCHRHHDTHYLHSFTAKIKNGVVYVDCLSFGQTYIESTVYDVNGDETITQWAGTTVAAANRLEMLGIDFDSIEAKKEGIT